ncbi:Hpt domain-containing protein [Granulosicoccaceae sp. 1_MG-2023]|nr:Hpt domain-containing protein [Granulosicoccaceae sp. 1_MG-2023]
MSGEGATRGLTYRSRVLDELLLSLADVRQGIERYVSDGRDSESLPSLISRVHAVAQTLVLLDLQGAALLARETEALLSGLADDRIRDQDDALVILVRAGEQLPDYLRYIRHGSNDIPLALLPLLNDMRAVRGAGLLSEAVMLLPDFNRVRHLKPGSLDKDTERQFRRAIKHARAPLMKALLNWYRGRDEAGSVADIADVVESLYAASRGTDLSRLWRAALAVLESVFDGGLSSNAGIKSLFGHLERFLQHLMSLRSQAVYEITPPELFKNFLYYVALSESRGKRTQQLRATYQLDELLPPAAQRDQALHLLDGPGVKLLNAARDALAGELDQVKTAIEVYAHADEPDLQVLRDLPARLRTLGGSMEMLGMQRILAEGLSLASRIEAFCEQPDPDEAVLAELATDTLRIETAVDEYIHSRQQLHATRQDDEPGPAGAFLADHQADELLDKVLQESLRSFERVKEAYQKLLAGQQPQEQAQAMVQSLHETAGALQILPMPEVAVLLNALAAHVTQLPEAGAVPRQAQDAFADVVSLLEVYLELHIQHQPIMADLLDQAADALDLLENWLQARDAGADESGYDDTQQTQATLAVPQAPPPSTDMLDIFIEEAMQQFQAIGTGMRALRTDREDRAALEQVRRAYHTLKGSGRMVHAGAIAEFAWANENLLNRVLSGSVGFSAEVSAHLEQALAALPQLVDQLHGSSETVDGIDELQAEAFRLAESGGPVESETTAPTLSDLASAHDALEETTEPDEEPELDATIAEADEGDESDQLDPTRTLDLDNFADDSDTLQLPPMDQADTMPMDSDADAIAMASTLVSNPPPVVRLRDSSVVAGEGALEQQTSASAAFDPVLFDIFRNECRQHISTLRDILSRAMEADSRAAASDRMVRALHTLTGSAQTARVESVADMLAPVEAAVKSKQRTGERFSVGETRYLNEFVSALEQRLEALAGESEEPASVQAVVSRLGAFSEQVMADAEAFTKAPKLGELQSVFLEEAQDLTEDLQRQLARWKAHVSDRDIAMSLQSSLHTLKGSARVASYAGIADLAHAMEDAVQRWSDEPGAIPEDAFDVLGDAIEAVVLNLDQARNGGNPGYFDWLISELRSVRSDFTVEAEAPQQDDSQPDADETAEDAALTQALTLVEAGAYDSSQDASQTGGAVPGGRLRLDVAVLDRLTDLSNEGGVHQSRLMSGQQALQEIAGELDQTINRLRHQLREMEIESDAKVSSAAPGADSGEFDALEMDRYGRVQEISRAVLESFSDLDDLRYSLGVQLRRSEVELNEQARISNMVQETLSQIRMVRFSSLQTRLRETLLHAAQSCHKQAQLVLSGGDNIIDRQVLRHLTAPLEHLLRNAVAHGIEAPEVRSEAGKDSQGKVGLQVQIDDGDIMVAVSDDGAGVDFESIRRKAVDAGLLEEDETLSAQRALELMMRPGFSTSGQLDQIAGRGVGLDAVRRELQQIGGTLSMHSERGRGVVFRIRVPQSQFVNQVLMVSGVAGTVAIPAGRVHGVTRISRTQLPAGAGALSLDYNGQAYRLTSLETLLGEPPAAPDTREPALDIVFVQAGEERLALDVQAIPGHTEAIIKPVGRQVAALGGFSGACVQSDGEVVPVLDLAVLAARLRRGREEPVAGPMPVTPARRLSVLVVDDSVTMRKFAERALMRENYRPLMARDGVEAMSLMRQRRPDIVITDLEMPHMDGFELVGLIRDDAQLHDVPVVVISSRTGEKHRARLAQAGIQGFLGKPYRESELISTLAAIAQNLK